MLTIKNENTKPNEVTFYDLPVNTFAIVITPEYKDHIVYKHKRISDKVLNLTNGDSWTLNYNNPTNPLMCRILPKGTTFEIK